MLADLAAGNRLLRLIMFIRSQWHKRRSHLARAWDRHLPAICDKRPASAAHMGVQTQNHDGAAMRSKAEKVNFVPGGRRDEASVGTNVLDLAL